MKRTAGLVIVAAAALLALGPARTVRAAEPQRESDALIVSGTGQARVAPDLAMVRVGVETRSPRAADAIQENNRLMGQVVQAIRQLGIPDANIQTATYNVSQQYEPTPDATKQPPRLIFVVDNIAAIRVTDPSRAGAVIDAATAAGANQVQGVSFISSKEADARAEALRLAVQDAQNKAQVITKALGVRITAVENVTEAGAPIVYPQQRLEAMSAGVTAPAPVLPGENTIQATVTIRYRIAK